MPRQPHLTFNPQLLKLFVQNMSAVDSIAEQEESPDNRNADVTAFR